MVVRLGNKQLIEKLTGSAIFHDYARVFSATTGMAPAMRPVEHRQPALGLCESRSQEDRRPIAHFLPSRAVS